MLRYRCEKFESNLVYMSKNLSIILTKKSKDLEQIPIGTKVVVVTKPDSCKKKHIFSSESYSYTDIVELC